MIDAVAEYWHNFILFVANENTTLIATYILAIATVFLAFATYSMAKAAKQSAETMQASVIIQTEQLTYYYRPGIWLGIDYNPVSDANNDGLLMYIMTVNQVAVFNSSVSLAGIENNVQKRNMVGELGLRGYKSEITPQERKQKLVARLKANQETAVPKWECGKIIHNEQLWCLIGPMKYVKNDAIVETEWQEVTGDKWHRKWRLLNEKTEDDHYSWSITPDGTPERK